MSSKQLVHRPQQLPLIPEERRAYNRDFAKSALFCVGGKTERTRFEDKPIASWPDARIEYTGWELRDDDQDVLISLVHRARGMKWDAREGIKLEFTGFDLLRDLEWPSTKDYYKKLRECLDRLQGGTVTIWRAENGRAVRHKGQLLRKFSERIAEGVRYPLWQVYIESETAELFATEERRLELEWGERKVLSKPISKWLHSFIRSMNTNPDEWFVMQETMLFELCGSKSREPRTLRALVKSGLIEMASKSVIAEWKIFEGFVYVALKPGLDINRATAAANQRIQIALTGAGESDIEEIAA